jgi:hypothetical protein
VEQVAGLDERELLRDRLVEAVDGVGEGVAQPRELGGGEAAAGASVVAKLAQQTEAHAGVPLGESVQDQLPGAGRGVVRAWAAAGSASPRP